MDARRIFAAVMDEAGRLGLKPWERLALILAVALLLVMGKEARRVLVNVKFEPQDDPDHRDRPASVTTDSNGTPLTPGPIDPTGGMG